MKVWYCKRHSVSDLYLSTICMAARCIRLEGDSPAKCEIVEMQLVPTDARIVPPDLSLVHPEHRDPGWLPPGSDDGLPGSSQVRLIVVPYMWDGERWVESWQVVEDSPKDPWDYDP